MELFWPVGASHDHELTLLTADDDWTEWSWSCACG